MAIISIKKEDTWSKNPLFPGDEYIVDTMRRFGGFEPGDLICSACPFFGVPLKLEIAIRADGSMIFRSWKWTESEHGNNYLHTAEIPPEKCDKEFSFRKPFVSTPAQRETVNGLFSGRIRFEGLRLCPGATLQRVCPIDLEAEEARCGEKIFLA